MTRPAQRLSRARRPSGASARSWCSVLITLAYHLPANIRIWTGDFPSDEATTELNRWLALHAVRTLAGLVAVGASFRAIDAASSVTSSSTPP